MTATQAARARLSWRALPALAAGLCVGYLGGGLLPEMVRGFRSGLELSATAAGAIATVMLLATAATGMVMSPRAARPGRARLAMIGAALAALGYLLAGVSPSWAALVGALVLSGVGSGVTLAAATSALAAMPDPDRASGSTLIVNTIVGAALLGAIPIASGGQLMPVMLILAGVSVIGAVLLRRLPDAPVATIDVQREPIRFGFVLIVGGLLFRLVENGVWAFTDDIGVDVIGLSEEQMGILLSVTAFAALGGAVLQVVVGRRFGHLIPVVTLLVIDQASRTVLMLADSAPVFIGASLLWWASYMALFAYLLAMGAAMDPSGSWAARMAAIMVIGDALGPLAVGWLVDATGTGGFAIASGIVGLVSLLMIGFVAYTLDRDEAADPADAVNPAEALP